MDEHGNTLNSRTSVIIVGDGRCNGLPRRPDKLEELRRKVHRLAWITPEPQRYWNQASCAMPSIRRSATRLLLPEMPRN